MHPILPLWYLPCISQEFGLQAGEEKSGNIFQSGNQLKGYRWLQEPTDGLQSKQEARGLGAYAQEGSGLFSFTLLPLQRSRLQLAPHSRCRVPGENVTFVKLKSHAPPAFPLLPSSGKRENLAPFDFTVGDGEMDVDSPKPHKIGDSPKRGIKNPQKGVSTKG